MTKSENAVLAAHGSLLRGWPALLLAAAVLAAAVYSFSHRPLPPFPETRVRPDTMMVNALRKQGERLVAVGEQGRILVADSERGPWTEAKVEPQRGSTLTQLLFLGDRQAIAVGHDGWILRSEDGGNSWREVRFDQERSEPLLGLAGPYEGKLYAYGAFGLFLVSADQGRSWRTQALEEEGGAAAAPKPVEPAPAAEDESYDPFAGGTPQSDGISDRHLNAMARAADGSLWLVGERGLLARSRDGAQSWKVLEPIYAGSFFGVLAFKPSSLLVFGMRGNAFVSHDNGSSWTQSKVPVPLSLFGGSLDGDGNIVLVGASDVVLKSSDRGRSFKLVSQKDRRGLAAVVPAGGGWLTAGEAGIKLQTQGIGKSDSTATDPGAQP